MNKKLLLVIIAFVIGFLLLSFALGIYWIKTLSTSVSPADWFVAWGTLILALATFGTIFFSLEQEKRNRDAIAKNEEQHRNTEAKKEDRDRTERLLNEILEWALEINRNIALIDIEEIINPETTDTQYFAEKSSKYALNRESLEALIVHSGYLLLIGNTISQELGQAIGEVEANLRSLSVDLLKISNTLKEMPSTSTIDGMKNFNDKWNKFGISVRNILSLEKNTTSNIRQISQQVASAKLALLKQ